MMDENYGHEWAYHISQEKYEEIEEMDDYSMVATAVGYLPYIGLEAIKNYSEDDFENMAEDEEHICRLAQKIAMKISNLTPGSYAFLKKCNLPLPRVENSPLN